MPRAVPGSGPVNEQLFGLAHRGHSSAGEQEMLPGETSRKAPVCPDASPLLCPDPEQLFCIPRWKITIFKMRSCCSEFKLHTQRPAGIISRTILRHSPDFAAGDPDAPIIPNISR